MTQLDVDGAVRYESLELRTTELKMPSKNSKLAATWYSVQDRIEHARDSLKLVRPSLEALLDNSKVRSKALRRRARTRVQELETQAAKRFVRAKREAGIQVERLQTRLLAATGIASKLQLEELNNRLARLSKKVQALVGRGARRLGAGSA
jgi:hypothetical protein